MKKEKKYVPKTNELAEKELMFVNKWNNNKYICNC